MFDKIIENPLLLHPKAWWLPFISLAITLFGILFQGWNLQAIAIVFWWEVILMVGAALIRMVFALDNQPFLNTLFQKIGMLATGVIMGGAFIMFSVVFTFKIFEAGVDSTSFGGVAIQIKILQFSYLLGLIVHYFANGRYKTANPMEEMMSTFVHLLVLLALLMALTMHLIPKFPQLNQALWVCVALVVLKFIVDLLFAKIKEPFKEVFEKNKVDWRL
jgi:Family of unknown function (DUF6498)